MAEEPADGLTDDQRHDAAAGDLNLLAYMMLIGSTIFAGVNFFLGSLGWIAALATVSGTAGTTFGLLQRNEAIIAVSYTHLRAHETLRYLVCRLLLEKKK